MTVLFVLLVLLFLYVLFIVAPSVVMFFVTYSRKDGKKKKNYRLGDSCYLPYEQRMKEGLTHFRHSEHKELTAHAFDGISLVADYYPADSKTTAILMHGYNTFPIANFCIIGTELHKMGMNVLMPYERAHVKSGGKHSTLSMLERKDVLVWIEQAEKEGAEQIILYGISMGGASVAYALENVRTKAVKRAVVDCGFISPYEAMRKESVKRKLPFKLLIPYNILLSKILFHTDPRVEATESLAKTDIPVLFLYGGADDTVGVEEGRRMYEACASQKQFIEVQGAVHTVAYLAADKEQKEQIVEFLNIGRSDG